MNPLRHTYAKSVVRLRLSLGTAVLLALVVGLAWGLYLVSECARKAEVRAECAEDDQNRLRKAYFGAFFDDPLSLHSKGLGLLAAENPAFRVELMSHANPDQSIQYESLLIFFRNPSEMVEGQSYSFPEFMHHCCSNLYIYDMNPDTCSMYAFPFDYNYRIQALTIKGRILTVTLSKGNENPQVQASCSLPASGTELAFLDLSFNLRRQMELTDPQYKDWSIYEFASRWPE